MRWCWVIRMCVAVTWAFVWVQQANYPLLIISIPIGWTHQVVWMKTSCGLAPYHVFSQTGWTDRSMKFSFSFTCFSQFVTGFSDQWQVKRIYRLLHNQQHLGSVPVIHAVEVFNEHNSLPWFPYSLLFLGLCVVDESLWCNWGYSSGAAHLPLWLIHQFK